MNSNGMDVYKFAVGQSVRVKPCAEIRAGLDPFQQRDGCQFMELMSRYCGSKFNVQKLVYKCYDEFEQKMFKPRAPLYILGGLFCDGHVDSFPSRCDRTCPLLWHEDWLDPA